MFLKLPHKKTNIYIASKKLLYHCYELTIDIEAEEKSLIAEQIRKAALMAHMAVTKALLSKKKSGKRKHFKAAVQAYIIVDAGLEIILELGWKTSDQMSELSNEIQTIFDVLTKRAEK